MFNRLFQNAISSLKCPAHEMYFSQHVCRCLTVSSGLSWSLWVTARMTPARHDQLAMCAGSSGSSPLTHRNRFPTTMAKNPRKLQHSHPTDRTFTPSNCVLSKKKEGTVIVFAFLRVDRNPGDLNFFQPPPANGRSRAQWNWTLDLITANVKPVSLRLTQLTCTWKQQGDFYIRQTD